MAASGRALSRRSFFISGLAAASARGEGVKGGSFPSDAGRYADPATELDVFRLTDPGYTSLLPAYYNRAIAKNSAWMIFTCDRNGSPQVFRMDLKTAATRQLTDSADIDPSSVTLTPDNRSFCYFAGRSLQIENLSTLRSRELYQIPQSWERCAGMTVGPDGTHVTFAEKQGTGSRLQMITLVQGAARTVIEAPFEISDPIPRPMRAQILYRQGDEGLWLVNSDGKQNRQIKTAEGRTGPANWAPDGKTILYLNFPADTRQLNNIRESTPDTNGDKLVAKTSQFGHFGFNHDTSVFAGASRSVGSPYLLLLLRVTQRERTLCEHKSSKVDLVAPIFSPDSQRVYFQSDRHGKPAIYDMHIEKLVEKTETEG
jgi:oligogalacturonide lyase